MEQYCKVMIFLLLGDNMVEMFYRCFRYIRLEIDIKICRDLIYVILKELLLTFTILDLPYLTPSNLTHPKFQLILYTFILNKLIAISVYSSNISSLTSYSFFAHQVHASRTYATLFARFSKVNLQS